MGLLSLETKLIIYNFFNVKMDLKVNINGTQNLL